VWRSFRFRVRFHQETRDLPIYRLTVAKGGHKLKEASCLVGSRLVRALPTAGRGHGIVDPGSMKWTPLDANPGPDSAPDLSTALKAQLGLKLEPARSPVEVVVIDQVAPPSAN
jgi:hypothetical protein